MRAKPYNPLWQELQREEARETLAEIVPKGAKIVTHTLALPPGIEAAFV